MTTPIPSPCPWSAAGMAERRNWIFENVRRRFHPFFNESGQWLSPPGLNKNPDPRVLAQVSLPLFLGDENDQRLARQLLASDWVQGRINNCSFTTEYLLTLLYAGGDAVPADVRSQLESRMGSGLLRYATRDLRHHGYNDNHVTLATGSLVLGGEYLGVPEALEQGRINLLNFRDTFIRRGFMHETNDCYIPHSLYPIAAVAEWAQDEEIRQLALDCEARIWADWIGHWHPNLSRKPGPSARDYTRGRLDPLIFATALWSVFGDGFGQPAYPPADAFAEQRPAERYFDFNGNPFDGHWNLGFLSRFCSHPYHVPDNVAALIYDRAYPHLTSGTHETGHFDETTQFPVDGKKKTVVLPEAVPFSAREIFTYQWQERDWAMGSASQRMIGNCPNNNWSIVYRKADPFVSSSQQGAVYCSFTTNDKSTTGEHYFQMLADNPDAKNKEDVEHWLDSGRYAIIQHERTSIVLYRPRVHDRHDIRSLATTLVLPLTYGNTYDQIWFGDQQIHDYSGESTEIQDIFIVDGPLYIGIRPLLSRPQSAPIRLRARKEQFWATIDILAYDGEPLNLSEMDLCRIGGGFICEVATKDDFASLEEFKSWFSQSQVLDEQFFFMRQVRYHRPGLDLGMRWDVWNDSIMWRTLNGRTMPIPAFHCTGIDNASLPWLAGDVSGLDHFNWAKNQAARPLNPEWGEPGIITA